MSGGAVAESPNMLPFDLPSPFSLFLDVDGTLIDIASRPDAVVVPHDLKQALATMAQRLNGAVALVSGRTIADIDHLFAPLRLCASGVHGAEMRLDPNGPVESADDAALPASIVAALRDIADRHPGTLIEDKRYSAAIHYRAVPESGPALRGELEALIAAPSSGDLRILPGHMVYEIKCAGFDKGVAIERFLAREPFAGRFPVFIGDDVTDEPGFEAVVARGGLAASVGAARRGASGLFSSPSEVRAWLAGLARDAAVH